jgi:hypothetical protein
VYVIGHGTEIVELIDVRHRTKIARALGHLFVIAMQISENRLELAHDLTFDSHDGVWSYIGTDCRRIPLNEATMNLGFLDGGTAAHEFGEWSLANTLFRFAITIAPAGWANTRSKSLRPDR